MTNYYDEDGLLNVAESLMTLNRHDCIVGRCYILYRFGRIPEKEEFNDEIRQVRRRIYKRLIDREKHVWIQEVLRMKRFYEVVDFMKEDPFELFSRDITPELFAKLDTEAAESYDKIISKRRIILDWE